MILRFSIFIFLFLIIGCSGTIYSFRTETITSSVTINGVESTLTRTGPTALFVENDIINKINIIEYDGLTSKSITIESIYDPESETSAALFSNIVPAIVGFIAGVF